MSAAGPEASARDPRPRIAVPRDALPMPLVIGVGAVLALALFLFLNAHRLSVRRAQLGETKTAASPGGPNAMAIPPLIVPPAPPPAPIVIHDSPPASPTPSPQPSRLPAQPPALLGGEPPLAKRPPEATPPPASRGGGNALVVDLTSGSGASVNAGGSADPKALAEGLAEDGAARATTIRNRASLIPQGAIIAAVLETPLNSDRPGLARAIVSKDARGFDGSRVLIPRGSRLIGEFKADNHPGLRRVLVTWQRLIRPDGVAIRIGSPVSDPLGGAGAPGSVNTHFAERFASAVLQSALTIGVNVASALPLNNSGTSYFVGLPNQASQIGTQLVPSVNRAPTVKVKEGAEIAVLVARDLDFSGTPPVR